jgi:sugar lactone lactonase YvrE
MRSFSLRLGAVALLLAAPLAGCAQSGASAPGFNPQFEAPAKAKPKPTPTPTPVPTPPLYVVNGAAISSSSNASVNVYRTDTGFLTLTRGITAPRAVAFSSTQAFIANGIASSSSGEQGASVVVYRLDAKKFVKRLTNGVTAPVALALDSQGDLFVANNIGGGSSSSSSSSSSGASIAVYSGSADSPSRTITTGVSNPIALAVDAKDNLYVLNAGGSSSSSSATSGALGSSVTVYAKGASKPTKTLTDGLDISTAFALDPKGDLYVANAAGSGKTASGSVVEFAPAATKPRLTIADGIADPGALAFDASGALYVLNGVASSSSSGSSSSGASSSSAAPTITVYTKATKTAANLTLSRTITKDLTAPSGLAVTPNGTLYVANVPAGSSSSGSNATNAASIDVFAPGASSSSSSITKGLGVPVELAIP